MRVLVTGANGFLGHYLVAALIRGNHEVIATGRGGCRLPFSHERFQYVSMDFTDPFAVHDVFTKFTPGVVVHAGAISKPDDCEQQQWQSYLVNVEGTLNMLLNAEEHKSFFVFLSSDFVFDGEKGMYSEEDVPNPVNFYGRTKAEAEDAVREYPYDWAIVRTILVYGKPIPGKDNLLSVVKSKLENGEHYNVFDDQMRTPTYVEDLATGIISVIEKKAKGIYHLSGIDVLTPYEMACQLADHLGLDKSLLKKTTSGEFPQPAKRPPRTGFNIQKAKTELGFNPLPFQKGLLKSFEGEN
jgi:dTDP-4-dehydrorhamnose reductase